MALEPYLPHHGNISSPCQVDSSLHKFPMMQLPRSRAFWTFTGTALTFTGTVALDKYKLYGIRTRLKEEASQLGQQPASEHIRKVTILSFGKDSEELRKKRRLWRKYAVDLLTLAGCDYRLVEGDAAAIDKEVDRRTPVPDGQIPENTKAIPNIANALNWFGSSIAFWISRVNGRNDGGWENWFDGNEALKSVWEEKRIEPIDRAFLDDGVVALDGETYYAIVKATKGEPRIETRLGYIPCDPPPNWGHSFIQVHYCIARVYDY